MYSLSLLSVLLQNNQKRLQRRLIAFWLELPGAAT